MVVLNNLKYLVILVLSTNISKIAFFFIGSTSLKGFEPQKIFFNINIFSRNSKMIIRDGLSGKIFRLAIIYVTVKV